MNFAIFIAFVCPLAVITAGQLTPPTMVFPPKDSDDPDDAVAGQRMVIHCKATGSKPMEFKWKKSGKEIVSVPPYITVKSTNDSSDLTIQSLTSYNDGKYQCFASNAAGATFSRKLRLKVTATSDFKEKQDVIKNKDVTVGRPLHITCPDHSDPKSTDFGAFHSWGRKIQGGIVETLAMKKNIATLPNGDLFFTYFSQNDLNVLKEYPFSSQLQCFVTAGNTVYRSHVYRLVVKGTDIAPFAPQFAPGGEPMQKESAVQGKQKSLHCVASGNPAPQTTWMRVSDDGKEKVIENGKDGFILSKINFGRVLQIPRVSKEQHEPGYYKCVVSNSQGRTSSKKIKLTVYVPPQWIVTPPPTKAVPVLGDSSLTCEAFGTPAPKYQWYHSGTEFKSDTEMSPYIIVDGNRLLFKKIERKNQGVFQCAVENDYGMIVSSTWLQIEARAPKIRNFGPFYLFRGTKAVLVCDSNAAPAAQHEWKKNDQVIAFSGRYSLGVQNSLVIDNVTSGDGGKYTCLASNDQGKDDASNSATVYDRTEIFRPPKKNMFITLNKALDLHCEARTDKRLEQFLTYVWLKDGRKIDYDSRVRWLENQNILKIEDANINDGAMYTCVAYTNAPQRSEDRATAIADVKGVPFPPSDLKITSCSNRTTIISWTKGRANDAPITHYVVEQESTYFPEEWHVIVNITDPAKTSYTLQLTAWANLTFRMRAINKIGPSRASMPTPKGQCVTNMFRPTMCPKNFRGVPKKANELDIAWTPMTKLEANAPDLEYFLRYRKIPDKGEKGSWIPVTIKNPKDDHYSIPDAGYYQLWEFTIFARNKVGEGPDCDIKKSFSGQDAPQNKPENVKMGKITARSIELSWDRVLVSRGSVDGYNIYYWGESKLVEAKRRRRRDIPAVAKVFQSLSTPDQVQTQNVTGLTPYTSYNIALKAYNSGGEGPKSDEVQFDTLQDVPGPVADFNAQAFSNYIFANWGQPEEKNGILLGYSIAAVKHKDKEPIKPVNQVEFVDLPTNTFEHLFKNVDSETRYVVYLQAKTIIGPGPVLTADVKTIAPAKPTKPRAPLADAHSTTAVNVTFLFGKTQGGYPLEFMVKYREKATNGSFKETGWFDHLVKRWAIVDGLSENRLYQFVTVGRNKLGVGPDSSPTDARPVPVVGSGKEKSPPFYKAPWFIILIVLIILLLLVILIALLYRRRRGAKYPVGKREKERAAILDQYPDEEEGMDMSKMDDNPPPYPSQGSLDKNNLSDDGDSLDGYGEGPEFKEDGSFIEEYGDDKKKLSDDKDKSASATFV